MVHMYKLTDDDMKNFFLLAEPIPLDGIGEFHSPFLTEIIRLTETKYNQCLSSLLFDKNQLEQANIDQYSNFQVAMAFILQDDTFREHFMGGLKLHFNTTPFLYQQDDEIAIFFEDAKEESKLTEDKFEYIRQLVSVANNVTIKEEEYEAGNERARKFMEKLKKKKEKLAKHQKKTMNLHSIISGVGWKSNSFPDIKKLNIYQLYDGYGRKAVIDSYTQTMSGIYAGTIDPKGIKLSELHWANIIQNK